MSDVLSAADEAALQRRRFLRGGALLAAAAGGAVAASATSAAPASAATGGTVLLGKDNSADAATTIESTEAAAPALALANDDGPALELTAASTDFSKALAKNQFAGTSLGPVFSTTDADGKPYTDFVASLSDVTAVPVVDYLYPSRILDTASSSGRGAIVGGSSGALDSKGRLQKGAYLQVAVDTTDKDYTPDAVFVTLTSSGSSADGYLQAYVDGHSRGGAVSVSFIKGKALSGAAFVGLQPRGGSYIFRIYASQTTYVAVDLTGMSYYPVPGPDADSDERRSARGAGRARSRVTARHTLG